MDINLGNYLETSIKNSGYTKKYLCNKINELYNLGDKPLSYTTFSNNIKNGEITLNEAVAIATLINLNLNKIVVAYKNKYNLISNQKGEFLNMKNEIIQILKDHSIAKKEYALENIYEIHNDEYEAINISEDFKVVTMERVVVEENKGYIQEIANFTNFEEILKEANMTTKDFEKMPLNEKLDFVAQEASDLRDILGEDMNEVCVEDISNYFKY